MNIFHSFILGVVEGVSEYLPISSTGHLILTSHLLGLEADDFLKSFEIAIQLGAIFAVVVLYWKRLFVDREIIKRIAVAFIPTGIAGFALYALLKSVLLENVGMVLWSLLLGGIAMILFEMRYKEKDYAAKDLSAISFKQSFFIGLFQGVSIIPGVSRAAATIIGGLVMGVDRKTIVEFSFLLAVPTMLAATGYDLLRNGHMFSLENIQLLVAGFATSFVVAMLAVRLLLKYITHHSFIVFGAYRIALVLAFWAAL